MSFPTPADPNNMPTAAIPAPVSNIDQLIPPTKWNDYNSAKSKLQGLITNFDSRARATQTRRDLRDVRVDNERLRKTEAISSDETYIPIRMIDSNVKRALPPLISYVKQSRRAAVFSIVGDPTANTEEVEREFTTAVHYPGWEIDLYKTYDCSATHGFSAVEICFDMDLVGRVRFDYVSNDELLFPNDTIDIQNCEFILRKFRMTQETLRMLCKKSGWDAEQVQKIVQSNGANSEMTQLMQSTFDIYKFFTKIDGVVYVGWTGNTQYVDNWLKTPEPFYNGIGSWDVNPAVQASLMLGVPPVDPATGQPLPPKLYSKAPETRYPFELYYFDVNEKRDITSYIGIAVRDEYKQEGTSMIVSAIVNGTKRSTNLYPSVDGKNPMEGKSKLAGQKLQHGIVMDGNIKLNQLQPPDASALRCAQYLETQNMQENNQIDFAVQNRQDSRKTAAEINAAQSQQNLISSANVTLLSTFMRNIYTRAWEIIKSQVLGGAETQYTILQDNPQLVLANYDIKAAGDTDVVERQERVEQMSQLLGIVQGTAAETQFRADLIRAALPDKGEIYANLIIQGSPERQLIQQLASVVMQAMQNGGQVTTPLPQLAQLGQATVQILGGQAGAQ